MLWGIYSAMYGEVNVSVEKCVEIKVRLCWKIAKLFYFCHLNKLVRSETFWTLLGIISSWILLRIGHFWGKSCIENQNTHFMLHNSQPPPPENRAVYEIIRQNIVEPERLQTTIRRRRIAFWIPKATNTHIEYVILIIADRITNIF